MGGDLEGGERPNVETLESQGPGSKEAIDVMALISERDHPWQDDDVPFATSEMGRLQDKDLASKTLPNPMNRSEHHAALAERFGRELSDADLSEPQKRQYARHFLRVIGRMNAETAKRVNDNLHEAHFFRSADELTGHLAEKYAAAKEVLDKGDVIGGAFAKGKLFLDGDADLRSSGGMAETRGQAHELYAHELGHPLDGYTENGKGISDTPEWQDAWREELVPGKPIGGYATESTREGFAEFARVLFGMGVDPKEMAERFPKSMKVFADNGLVGTGQEPFAKPAEVFAKPVNDGPLHADVLLGKAELRLNDRIKDAVVRFGTEESGALDLKRMGEVAEDLYDRIKAAWKYVANAEYKAGGGKLPLLHEHDMETGLKGVHFEAAPLAGRKASVDWIDKVLGKEPLTAKEKFELGETLIEERRQRKVANLRADAAVYSRALLGANKIGDRAAAKKFADKATEATNAAREAEDASYVGKPARQLKSQADYQRVLNSPRYKEIMDRYEKEFTPEIEQLFREAQGMDPAEAIVSRSQIEGRPFHLKALEEGPPRPEKTAGPAAGNLDNPKLRKLSSSYEASMTHPNYETSIDAIISDTYVSRYANAKKAEFVRRLVESGGAQWRKPGDPAAGAKNFSNINPPRGTQAAENGETSLWVKDHLAGEYRQLMRVDEPWHLPGFSKLAEVPTVASTYGTAEAVAHSSNLGTLMLKFASNPVSTVMDAWRLMRKSPETMDRIVELAKMGAWHEGHAANDTPRSKLDPRFYLQWTGKLLELVQQTTRLQLDKAYDRMIKWHNAPDTEQGRRDFVNQTGNYSKLSQLKIVKALREMGIGPFATAGINFMIQGWRSLTLNPGFKAESWRGAVTARAEMLARMAALVGVASVSNIVNWGRWDGDDDTPTFALKVGVSDKGKSQYIDPIAWIGLRRGMRQTGVLATVEGVRHDKTAGQIVDKGSKDALQAALHPVLGPLPSFLWTLGTGKDTMGRQVAERVSQAKTDTGVRSAEREGRPPPGSSQEWLNLKAALKRAIPGLGLVMGDQEQARDWSNDPGRAGQDTALEAVRPLIKYGEAGGSPKKRNGRR